MKRLLILSLLFLISCAPRPQAAMERVNHEFIGRDVTEFFISYGSPAGSQVASDGSKTYRWLSLEPGDSSHPASVITYPGRHFSTIGDTSNGEMITGYCEIRISTDADDHIKKLTLVSDSVGKYSGSRCAEIFSQAPN